MWATRRGGRSRGGVIGSRLSSCKIEGDGAGEGKRKSEHLRKGEETALNRWSSTIEGEIERKRAKHTKHIPTCILLHILMFSDQEAKRACIPIEFLFEKLRNKIRIYVFVSISRLFCFVPFVRDVSVMHA